MKGIVRRRKKKEKKEKKGQLEGAVKEIMRDLMGPDKTDDFT